MTAPTLDEVRGWPATVDVALACKALGISKAFGYQLTAAGEFPADVLRIGSRTRVLTNSLLAVLEGRVKP